MAITASLSLPNASAPFNQVLTANVTVSNSGGSDVTITSLRPIIQPSGSPTYEIGTDARSSGLPKGFGQVFTSPAGGSIQIPFSYVITNPQVAASSSALASPGTAYSISCYVTTSDGSLAAASPQTLTIIPLSLSSSQS